MELLDTEMRYLERLLGQLRENPLGHLGVASVLVHMRAHEKEAELIGLGISGGISKHGTEADGT